MRHKTPGYRYVEAQLYAYPTLKREAELERERILHSGVLLEVAVLGVRVQSSNTYDSTEAKGVELVDNKWLCRTMADLAAIESVINRLDLLSRRLVEMVYWDRRYSHYGVWNALHISRAQFYRLKDRAVMMIAREMGMARQVSAN